MNYFLDFCKQLNINAKKKKSPENVSEKQPHVAII